MIAPLRPGVTLAQPGGPVVETERLRLRQWCSADIGPYTAMLADPPTARFITVDGNPVSDVEALSSRLEAAAKEKSAAIVLQVRRGVRTLFVQLEPVWK